MGLNLPSQPGPIPYRLACWKVIAVRRLIPIFCRAQAKLQTSTRNLDVRRFIPVPHTNCRADPSRANTLWAVRSNAVSYYNSVVGARTQKYGDFLDVSCALLGRAPLAGLHRDQGRKANLLLDVSALPQDTFDQEVTYHLLGHIMGSTAGDRLPALQGMSSRPTDDQYKAIAAAGAASGGVAMFHVIGHTPEAASIDLACDAQVDCVEVTTTDLESARELSTFDHGTIDMVALGTPPLQCG